MEIESPPSALSRANPDGTGIRPQAGLIESVLSLIATVKQGASKVVDENGEPLVIASTPKAKSAAPQDATKNPPRPGGLPHLPNPMEST